MDIQSAFYPQSVFKPQSAVSILHVTLTVWLSPSENQWFSSFHFTFLGKDLSQLSIASLLSKEKK